jgi:hypothetical protein
MKAEPNLNGYNETCPSQLKRCLNDAVFGERWRIGASQFAL